MIFFLTRITWIKCVIIQASVFEASLSNTHPRFCNICWPGFFLRGGISRLRFRGFSSQGLGTKLDWYPRLRFEAWGSGFGWIIVFGPKVPSSTLESKLEGSSVVADLAYESGSRLLLFGTTTAQKL